MKAGLISEHWRVESQVAANKPWQRDWTGEIESKDEAVQIMVCRRVAMPEAYWRIVKVTEEVVP